MILRTGINNINRILSNTGMRRLSERTGANFTAGSIKNTVGDIIEITSKRRQALTQYNSAGERKSLYNFKSDGSIQINPRKYGSEDLMFLDHIKNGRYIPAKTFPEGTAGITREAQEQSNRLAGSIIPETERLMDGFRYNGASAVFDKSGKNISRFRNGNQEIDIIDRNLDKTLAKTIEAFKQRIAGKNYSEKEKIDELMKFVDEVFSVNPSGSATEQLVSRMHNPNLRETFLGDIINSGAGVCRHRSLLTKVLGDEIGLKTRIIQGQYGTGGHAWNEIVTSKGETFLFDGMHGNIFDVTNPSKNLTPQVFNYRISDALNAEKTVQKYFDKDSTAGLIYRSLGNRLPVNTNIAKLTPSQDGYIITPLSDKVKVNGKSIDSETKVLKGDWVQLKDISFEII